MQYSKPAVQNVTERASIQCGPLNHGVYVVEFVIVAIAKLSPKNLSFNGFYCLTSLQLRLAR